MNKKILLALLISVIGLSFYSCEKPVDGPVITVDGPSEVPSGENAAFTVTVSSNEDLGTLTVEQSVNGSQYGKIFDTTLSKNSRQLTYNYPVSSAAGDNIILKFTISDAAAKTAMVEKTLKVKTSANALRDCGVIILGNQNSTTGSFLQTKDECKVYTVSAAKQNQAAIDMIHYFGTTNGATISSPDDPTVDEFSAFAMNTWQTRNKTLFKALGNAVDPAGYTTVAQMKAAYDAAGGQSSKATQVGIGYCWAFKTADGRYGIFKVTGLSGSAASAGTIKIHVKTQ